MNQRKFIIFIALFPLLAVGSMALYYYGIFGVNQNENSDDKFSMAFNESLNQIISAGNCFNNNTNEEAIINCVLQKSALARSSIQSFTNEVGCVGDISTRLVDITDTLDTASQLLLSDTNNSSTDLASIFLEVDKKMIEIEQMPCISSSI